MSFLNLERYIWASLVAAIFFAGLYLVLASPISPGSDAVTPPLGAYLVVIILFAMVQGGLSVALAIAQKSDDIKKDERDLWIESKGYRNGYYFLFAAVNLLLVYMLGDAVVGEAGYVATITLALHGLVLAVFLAHITLLATQVYYYRWGS